jgi:hypothetical protein
MKKGQNIAYEKEPSNNNAVCSGVDLSNTNKKIQKKFTEKYTNKLKKKKVEKGTMF